MLETALSDNLPGFTCPQIDELKRVIRKGMTGEMKSRALRICEELREANAGLRRGYVGAMRRIKNAETSELLMPDTLGDGTI